MRERPRLCRQCGLPADAPIVCCWGDGGAIQGRAAMVRGALWDHRRKMFCLGNTKAGYPRHTSRLSYETALVPMWLGQ